LRTGRPRKVTDEDKKQIIELASFREKKIASLESNIEDSLNKIEELKALIQENKEELYNVKHELSNKQIAFKFDLAYSTITSTIKGKL